jgi:hypothetical protein
MSGGLVQACSGCNLGELTPAGLSGVTAQPHEYGHCAIDGFAHGAISFLKMQYQVVE